MPKWDYKVVRVRDPGTEDAFEHVLKVQGGYEWELVGVVREEKGYLCFFKTPSDKSFDAVMKASRQEARRE